MPKYMVERDILGAGGWSAEQMRTSPSQIREHAARGGSPCDRVSAVHAAIDPTTAER